MEYARTIYIYRERENFSFYPQVWGSLRLAPIRLMIHTFFYLNADKKKHAHPILRHANSNAEIRRVPRQNECCVSLSNFNYISSHNNYATEL